MPSNPEDIFRQFLGGHLRRPEALNDITRRLSAFFWKASQATYALTPGWQVAMDRTASAIGQAVGRQVCGVEFVSCGDIFGGLDGLTDPKSYGWPQWSDLSRRPLWSALKTAYEQRLRQSAGPAPRDQIWDQLRRQLLFDLFQALKRDVLAANPTLGDQDRRWTVLRDNLWLNLADSLTYFVIFGALDQTAAVGSLEPLIRLLPEAIPLCEKQSEPGNWLVLSA